MSNAGVSVLSRRGFASPRDRRRLLVLCGSVALHAAVLTPMAIGLFADRAVVPELSSSPVFIDMEPRPLLEGETARVPTPSSTFAQDAVPLTAEGLPSTARDLTRKEDEDDSPTAPLPRVATSPPPAGSSAPSDAWQVTPEGMAAAIARATRTGAGGCRIMDGRLSPGEQALCDERFNAAAGRAGPLGPRTLNASEARRDARFARDGAQALAQYETRRRPLAGGVGIIGPGDCPGSNLGAGCAGAHLDPAIRQGATTVGNPGLRGENSDAMRPIRGQE